MTHSIEEAQRNASVRFAPVRLDQLDRRTQFHWQSMAVNLGTIAISVNEYGAGFAVFAAEGASDRVAMSFPLSAVGGEATLAGTTHRIARDSSTYIYSPAGAASSRFDTNYRGLQAMISTRELSVALAALLGATLKEPLRFEPRLSLERGIGPALERAFGFVIAESELEDGLFSTPVAAQRFGDALLLKLLDGQRHNYSERLAKIRRAAPPRSVRVAAEYLESNFMRSVRIAELAAVAGVSVRALEIGFQKYHGSTPAEFLRDRRLTMARDRLLEGGPGASVAEVARQCGFAHLGRFSARYRARFGELPTETRRTRARS